MNMRHDIQSHTGRRESLNYRVTVPITSLIVVLKNNNVVQPQVFMIMITDTPMCYKLLG